MGDQTFGSIKEVDVVDLSVLVGVTVVDVTCGWRVVEDAVPGVFGFSFPFRVAKSSEVCEYNEPSCKD